MSLTLHRALRSEAFINFKSMPDEARVPDYVVAAILGISRATLHRRVRAGLIPAPERQGHTSRWIVGTVRAALAKGA
ncbi:MULTISPECIES: transcriptional regulator [unclassified Caballeronia]|uniref:helix-turn-helix transcriptional regulator n=1 Tax=unclassified Caballeronia TaxID=2646786 RepID=UPI002864F0A3|nr:MULTISPECIES: transcriptional regulator [unclassified Caballeronia]MDR5770873.1 transcriptional regulator [Caballeronia sp. LZ002]MDR5846310.1 transcriptional regulator [Caballeronia sp. LZ003]